MQHLGQKTGKFRLLDTAAEEDGIGSQTANFVAQYIHQLFLSFRPFVGELFFEMVPDTFIGIQFRGIGWKRHQVKPTCTRQEFLDGIAAVNLAIVPKNYQCTGYVP
jgi:hypothetical protein